jgi:nucleotide-binding universal stress UspA family protein
MQTAIAHPPASSASLFGKVLCVTERSGGAEALRQATLLAGAGAGVELLALAPDPTPHQARAVLERCAGHGLLVLPAGPLARTVLPRATIPVLVARRAPSGGDFPGSVLVAVDGSPEAHDAARLGARLAAREGATVALVASPEHDAPHQSALQHDAETVERLSGRWPLILDEHGAPAPSILAAAASLEASLIVLGSRPGRPVASVSCEVAEAAPCSVLVLRPARSLSPPVAART